MSENPRTRTTNGDHSTNYNLPVSDHVFDRARRLVKISDILSVLRRWRDDDREPGRYDVGGAINDYAVVTAWLIAAIERRVPQHQVLAEILFERLDTEHRLALDMRDDGYPIAPRRTAAVGRALHRILSLIDPFPTSRSRRHTFEEAQRVIEEHDKELESRRSPRLDELTTRLIAASMLRAVHKSLELYVATDVVIIPGPALPANGWRGPGPRGGNAGVSDPFAAALPNPSRRAHLDGPLWGWKAHLAVPYPPLDFAGKLPLIVAGATLQRPGQTDSDAVLAVLDSARRSGLRRLPIRTSPDGVTLGGPKGEPPFGIPGPPRSRSHDYPGERRAEGIHARGVEANVLGHLHRRSRGLAHTQLSLAIHLAAMNACTVDGEIGDGRKAEAGWYRHSRGSGDRHVSSPEAGSTRRTWGGFEAAR